MKSASLLTAAEGGEVRVLGLYSRECEPQIILSRAGLSVPPPIPGPAMDEVRLRKVQLIPRFLSARISELHDELSVAIV